MTTIEAGGAPAVGAAPLDVMPARARPVVWLAVAGAAFLAFQVYLYGAWVVSGDASRVGTGADAVPSSAKAWAIAFQVLGCLLTAVMVTYVVRRSLRERRLAFDAILVVAWASLFWQDPILNYVRPQFFYNSQLLNLGSWVEHIPGWSSPNGRLLPEPLLFTGNAYFWMGPAMTIAACAVMRWVRRRRPLTSAPGLVLSAYVAMLVADLVMEIVFIRTSLYAYPGAIHALSVWGGERYQFPIYESIFWGAMWTAMGALRYFRDDKGRSVAERGIDDVRASARVRTALRTLAVVGFANLGMLVYNVAINVPALHATDTPEGYPSYMTNGICGEGTPYPCPGQDVPIPLRSNPDTVLAGGR